MKTGWIKSFEGNFFHGSLFSTMFQDNAYKKLAEIFGCDEKFKCSVEDRRRKERGIVFNHIASIEETKKHVNITQEVKINYEENKTEFTINIDYNETETVVGDVYIYVEIPKCLVEIIKEELIDEETEKKGDLIVAVMGEIRRDKAENQKPLNALIRKLTLYSEDKEKTQVLRQAEEDLIGTCKIEKIEILTAKEEGKEIQGYTDVRFRTDY